MYRKNRLSSAVVAVIASVAGINQATAQDDAPVVEEILVTGIRASIEAAMDVKRESTGVVDAISAEDIGKMPDANLAESLQRIAGVSISRTNGEGAQVTVRGIDPSLNMVTLNGRVMPTVTNNGTAGDKSSRAFDFANLASEVINGVQVYKTGKANVAGGGLGANINLDTIRPLDLGEIKGSVGVKAVHDETVGRSDVGRQFTPEVSGLYTWVNDEENFGVMVTGAFQQRDNVRSNAFVNNWQLRDNGTNDDVQDGAIPAGAAVTGSPALWAIPTDLRYALEDNSRTRTNGQATIQFRPVESITTTVDYTYSEYELAADRSQQSTWYNESAITRLQFDSGQEVATPLIYEETYTTAQGKDVSFAQQDFMATTIGESIGFNIEWEMNESVTLELDYHDSQARNRTDQTEMGLNANVVVMEYSDWSNDLPIMGVEIDDSRADKGNNNGELDGGDVSSAMGSSRFDLQTAGTKELRLMGEVDLGELAFFEESSVSFGLTQRNDSNRSILNTGESPRITMGNWGGVDPDVFGPDWGSYYTPRDFGKAFPSNSSATGNIEFFRDGLDGDFHKIKESIENAYANAQSRIMVSVQDDPATAMVDESESYWVTQLDSAGNHRMYEETEGLHPGNFNNFVNGKIQPNNVISIDRKIAEKVTAAYVQLQGSFEIGGMESNLTIGLRQESTDLTSVANVVVPTGQSWDGDNDFTIISSGQEQLYPATNSYDNFLPNIDFDIAVTDDIKVRASYSVTMARTGFGNLSSATTIDNPYLRQASGGNPELVPMESTNLDLSVEWYYGDASYVSVALFQKDVTDFVGTTTESAQAYGLRDPRSTDAGTRYSQALAIIQGYIDADPTTISPATGQPWSITSEADQHWVTLEVDGKDPMDESTSVIADAAEGDPLQMWDMTRPVNFAEDTITGVEFSIQHWFGDTGLGVMANYTAMETDLEMDNTSTERQYALVGAGDSANLAGFYDKNGIQARLAYNWRDDFLTSTTQGGNNAPGYTQDYSQLDFTVSYDLNDSVTVAAEGLNILGSDSRLYGRSEAQMFSMEDLGARYQVGVRYSF